jgi:hypothetical protein
VEFLNLFNYLLEIIYNYDLGNITGDDITEPLNFIQYDQYPSGIKVKVESKISTKMVWISDTGSRGGTGAE